MQQNCVANSIPRSCYQQSKTWLYYSRTPKKQVVFQLVRENSYIQNPNSYIQNPAHVNLFMLPFSPVIMTSFSFEHINKQITK